MPNKIVIVPNKTLKLSNVLIKTLLESEYNDPIKSAIMMENFIKSQNVSPLGPHIQLIKMNELDYSPKLEFFILRACLKSFKYDRQKG